MTDRREDWETYLTTGVNPGRRLQFAQDETALCWPDAVPSTLGSYIRVQERFVKRFVRTFPHVVRMEEERGRSLPGDARAILEHHRRNKSAKLWMAPPEVRAWIRWIVLSNPQSAPGGPDERDAKVFVRDFLMIGEPVPLLTDAMTQYMTHVENLIAMDESRMHAASSSSTTTPWIAPSMGEELEEFNLINERARADLLKLVGRYRYLVRFPRYPTRRPKDVKESRLIAVWDEARKVINQSIKDENDKTGSVTPTINSGDIDALLIAFAQLNDAELRELEDKIRHHPYLAEVIPRYRSEPYNEGLHTYGSNKRGRINDYQKEMFVQRLREEGAENVISASEAADTWKRRRMNLFPMDPALYDEFPVERSSGFGKNQAYMIK